jgi:hypothetical protein
VVHQFEAPVQNWLGFRGSIAVGLDLAGPGPTSRGAHRLLMSAFRKPSARALSVTPAMPNQRTAANLDPASTLAHD